VARQIAERDLSSTLQAAAQWIDIALIDDRSVLSKAALWTPELVEECREAFVEHPDEGQDDFMTKLKGQMRNSSGASQRLMAEMLWALLLFPSNIRAVTKRQHVRDMWALSGQELEPHLPLMSDEVLRGIGSGGPGFNNHRWRELVFLISLTGSIKQREISERREVFSDYDRFVDWIDTVPQEGHRQFRHMLRFFAFPDQVERMSSSRDRRAVLVAYDVASQRDVGSWDDRRLDNALLNLRKELEEERPGAVLDFYEHPLKARWQAEDAAERDEAEPPDSPASAAPAVWIEKTIVQGRQDRMDGEYALGRMLWSPQRAKNGGDIYRFMREVRPGNMVLHLTDNEGFTGASIADSAAEEFNGLTGTDWAERPSYRIRLREYRQLEPPLHRDTFFREPYAQQLVDLLDQGGQNLFYNRGPALNQGAYLTPAPPDLLAVLNAAYQSVAGRPLLGQVKPTVAISSLGGREDLPAIIADFAGQLRHADLYFGAAHVRTVRAFIASLAAKRFVILTGLSGSGKSQIAMKFGQWAGPRSYKLVPVRPDWTGPEALFGYEDALQKGKDGRKGWHVPEPLEFMLEAAAHPEMPYVLILDEMNLAHVERYFADALSGMETSEPCLPNLKRDPSGTWTVDMGGQAKVAFPRNLFVIGTVNVDETTYLFSPKVLDRANTFEFRVGTDDLSATARKPVDGAPGDPALVQGFLAIASKDNWHLENPAPWLQDYTFQLQVLHRLLSESSLEFGHRVYYEAVRFAALHAASGETAMEAALDRQVIQKILPRIHGSRKRVEAALCALGQFCFDLTYIPGAAHPGSQVAFDPTKADPASAKLPLSLDKVRRMVQTVRANQFTSFTD
jgi:MoxR-like ATPase